MLNVDRPQNPFIPTYEPDWNVSKTAPGGSHALKYDRPKDQNSHRHSQTSEESQALPLDTLRPKVLLRGPNSKSSSESSVVSMSPSVAHKATPPIPKKPALLSNQHRSQESENNEQGKFMLSKPPSGYQTTFADGPKATSLPQPTKQQEVYGQQATKSDGTPLPPRSTGAIVSVPHGLMDDDNDGASTIPSLQPMRRQQ